MAFGIDKLRHARTTTLGDLAQLDETIPTDRSKEWEQTRRQLPEILRARHNAEQEIADHRAALHEASRRRWGRHDHNAIAAARAEVAVTEQRTKQAITAEHNLRERLDAISQYQQQRRKEIADSTPTRRALETKLTEIDRALDYTRPDRIRALVEDPPSHLVDRLGPPPSSPAGRAVWCHHALAVEGVLDRNDGELLSSTRGQRSVRAMQEIALADRLLEISSAVPGTSEWADLADRAAKLGDEVRSHKRMQAAIKRQSAETQEFQRQVEMDNFATLRRPELGI